MRTAKSVVIYLLILILELIRLFSFVYVEKMNINFGSLLDFTGILVLFLPAIILFLILNNEKEFYKFLNIVVVFKILSIIGFYLYWSSIVTKLNVMIRDLDRANMITYILLPFLISVVDMFILVFSLLKEKALCKSYQ